MGRTLERLDMTSGQHIDYDALALEALRGVVRACLAQVSREGLLGEHHFYIAFNTLAPGVGMSKRLKEKYPVEMTIVLQHRFWDLAVDEDRFEVKLTFDGIPERLVVPFAAVKVFYDPSVPYVLQFEEVDVAGQGEGARRGVRRGQSALQPGAAPAEASANSGKADPEPAADRRRPTRRNRSERDNVEATEVADKAGNADELSEVAPARPFAPPAAVGKPVAPPPAVAPAAASGGKPAIVAVSKSTDEEPKSDDEDAEAEADAGSAKIFDLSKFRGKK